MTSKRRSLQLGPFLLSLLLTAQLPFSARAEKVLFHAGSRTLLEEDIAAGTVPKIAWDRFIMGQTNFDLPAHRKGLYGAETLAGTSLYSLYQVLGGRAPWVMMIHIKDECMSDSATHTGEYTLELKRPSNRFTKWYVRHRADYRPREKLCVSTFGQDSAWEEGALYSVSDSDSQDREKTRLCSPVLERFLVEEHIKVVFDLVNQDSWYVRDRDCIATIDGRPGELFDAIFANRIGPADEDWMTNMYGDPVRPGSFAGGSTFIALTALSEAELTIPRRDLLRAASADIRTWLRGEKEPERLSFDRNSDHPFLLLKGVEGALKALDSGRGAEFQVALRARLTDMIAALGKACQGKNGVKADHRQACDEATSRESAQLLLVLQRQ